MSRFPNQFSAGAGLVLGTPYIASGTTSTFTLNASTNRIGFRYTAETTKPIAGFWLFQTAVTGTAGNVTNEGELRNQNATVTIPGATVHRTAASIGSVGANRWCRWLFDTTYTPALNETVWCSVRPTNGAPATDFATYRTNVATQRWGRFVGDSFIGYTSTNSWTGSTLVANLVALLEFDDGSLIGVPWTAISSATYTNNTAFRGVEFPAQPEDWWVFAINGIAGFNWHNQTNGIRIYGSDQIPTDTPLAQWDTPNEASLSSGAGRFVLPTPFLMRAGRGHILGCVPTANSQRPVVLSVADTASYTSQLEALRSSSCGGVPIQANGSAWTRYDGFSAVAIEGFRFPDLGGARLVA